MPKPMRANANVRLWITYTSNLVPLISAGTKSLKALVTIAILKMNGWHYIARPMTTKRPTMAASPKTKLQIIMRTWPQLKRSFFKDLYILTDLMILRSLFDA
jgi:hypothetical protein